MIQVTEVKIWTMNYVYPVPRRIMTEPELNVRYKRALSLSARDENEIKFSRSLASKYFLRGPKVHTQKQKKESQRNKYWDLTLYSLQIKTITSFWKKQNRKISFYIFTLQELSSTTTTKKGHHHKNLWQLRASESFLKESSSILIQP